MNLALFDLDNTLLDRVAAFARWSREFVRVHGLPQEAVSFMESADQDGLTPRATLFGQIREAFGIRSEVEELVTSYYEAYPACYAVDAQTIDGLRRLRAGGWSVGIVTNGGFAQLAKLNYTGLVHEVDAVCVSEVVGAAKPDPAIFELAARLCGKSLNGWMTGDSAAADIAGGYGVGLQTIWMARGRPWPSQKSPPDAIVETVPQAVEIILGSCHD